MASPHTTVLERPLSPTTQAAEDGEDEDDEEGVCTTECVREFKSEKQFEKILAAASPETLIVVDFYRTACGSCRYIGAGGAAAVHGVSAPHGMQCPRAALQVSSSSVKGAMKSMRL